jgi:hypothetical protein
MKRLLGDLLTLSRSDCSRLELVRQRIDPLPLLQELVDQKKYYIPIHFLMDVLEKIVLLHT